MPVPAVFGSTRQPQIAPSVIEAVTINVVDIESFRRVQQESVHTKQGAVAFGWLNTPRCIEAPTGTYNKPLVCQNVDCVLLVYECPVSASKRDFDN